MSEHALDWNGPVDRPFEPFAESDKATPVSTLFARIATAHGDRIALRAAGEVLTYRGLYRRVRHLAAEVAESTDAGDLVGLYLPASADFGIAMLACLAAGRAFVPLDVRYPRIWLEDVTADAAPALILVDGPGDGAAALPAASRTLDLSTLTAGGADTPVPLRPLGPDEPACVLYTSGSSGRPKGIVNSQRNLLQRVAQSINAAHFNADDRFLTLASLCTVVGVRDLLTAWLCGAGVSIVDAQAIGAREVMSTIRDEEITVLFAFPALLRVLMDLATEGAAGSLRLVRAGGDTLLWNDVARLRAWMAPGGAVQLIYAATEAPMMQWFVSEALRDGGAGVPIGFPLPGNDIAIVDESGAPVSVGEVGEMVVTSPYVALGYWIGGACAPGAIARDPGDGARRTWRTGDLARRRSDGLLELAGRKDRQVKIGGLRVAPEGVEAVLNAMPGVREAATITRGAGEGKAAGLVAYIVGEPDAPDDLLELVTTALRERLPPHMRPRALFRIDAIPRLPSSKPDIRALAAIDARRSAESRQPVEDAPIDGDRVARTAASAWEGVLGRPPAGPDANFFDAGGDSLQALNLAFALERALNTELDVSLIATAPTFGELCAALRARGPVGPRALVLLKAGDRTGSLFMVPSVGGNVMELAALARRMTWPGLVWGLPARGLDGREEPFASVEAMAQAHLEVIRARQPQGPYNLCGYSFGGLVAYDMARRLHAAGEDVAFLGMFDTVPNIRRWPLRAWFSYAALRMVRRAAALATMPMREWPDYIAAQGARAWRHAAWRLRRGDGPSPFLPAAPEDAPPQYGTVMLAAIRASANYRLHPYPGVLTLFRPIGRDPDFARSEAIWWRYVHDLRLHVLPGTHGSLLREPNVSAAAEALSASLSAPLPQAPGGLTVQR